MKYNPEIHHRKSIRLKKYDYSQSGAYFITICTQNRELLIVDDEIKTMIKSSWEELQNKFSGIELDEFIMMPNHVHGIITIVGADLRVCPDNKKGEHIGSPLHKIIQWFKTMTTNYYIEDIKNKNWKPFNKKFWQRNYYEHIIRNEIELNKIREYIVNNPLKWELDFENPERKKEYKNFTDYLKDKLSQRIRTPN